MNVRRVKAMLRALAATFKVAHEDDRPHLARVGSLLKTALNEYQQHFQDKLKEHGLSSINGEDPEKLSAFFKDMKESWQAKK